uniref:Retrovirus-related Pol polyprotein from transposon TNT 1-94 n=1 Tax=Ananas comosus var. bracteatus TaxID=296719 RepID=A0A6V7NH06_ANACO|nr:unnamed protein product [Ananas comosus var. bracteatus]
MTTNRLEVDKFDGKRNFELWKLKVHDLLVQYGQYKALLRRDKKPEWITDDEWEEMDMKALATIRMCLADEVLFNIIGEKTAFELWVKLESLYQNKSITNGFS